MNDLSNALLRDHQNNRHCCSCKPFPSPSLWVLASLFFLGFSVSIFIFVVVHNAIFFISFLLLSSLVLSFVVWNLVNWRRKGAILIFLNSFPDSDLRFATDGQLVKITGSASCGSISLESSYEKWSSAYSERFSTDFYITDMKSGMRAMVKAGYGAKVTPLIGESTLINTTSKNRILSPYLTKWLGERNLSAEARLLRLDEGYVKEGSSVTVIGLLHRNNDDVMIVHPSELISTGCLWKKFLIPIDVDGLILTVPENNGSVA